MTSLSFSSVLGSRSVLKDGEGAPDPLLAGGASGLQQSFTFSQLTLGAPSSGSWDTVA